MFRAAEIGDPDAGRVCLSAGTPDRDDAQAVAPAPGDESRLGSKAVDAIDDVIMMAAQQGLEIIHREKILDGRHPAQRVDLLNAFGHDPDLGLAQGRVQGRALPVDIGFGNVIHVDQGEVTDGRTCQCLGGPGTHAANPQHTHMGSPEPCQCRLTIQAADAAETAFQVRIITARVNAFRGLHEANIPENTHNNGCVYPWHAHTIRTMELIDSHCHLDVSDFDADRLAVLQRARHNGIAGIVVPGIESAGWDALWQLCRSEAGLYPAFGLHPVFLQQHTAADLPALQALLQRHPPVAVGEIGLDYHVEDLDRDAQQTVFEAQLELARDAGLPVILHVRKSHDQVLATLKRVRVCGGICHAFNGSQQQASLYHDMGFSFGFGGMLTYERSTRLRALAKALPLESIVLETDAPDMTVAQHRGERNSPEYLPYCLAALAGVRGEDAEEIARVTTANAREVLKLEAWEPL